MIQNYNRRLESSYNIQTRNGSDLFQHNTKSLRNTEDKMATYSTGSDAKSTVNVATHGTARHRHRTVELRRDWHRAAEVTVGVPVSVISSTATLQLHATQSATLYATQPAILYATLQLHTVHPATLHATYPATLHTTLQLHATQSATLHVTLQLHTIQPATLIQGSHSNDISKFQDFSAP